MLHQPDETDYGPGQDNADRIGVTSGDTEDNGRAHTVVDCHTSTTQLGSTLASLHRIPGASIGTAASPGNQVAVSVRSGEAVADGGGTSELSFLDTMALNEETQALNNNEQQKQLDMMTANLTTGDYWAATVSVHQYAMNASVDAAASAADSGTHGTCGSNNVIATSDRHVEPAPSPLTTTSFGKSFAELGDRDSATSAAAHGKNQAIGEAPSGIRPSSWTAWTSRFVKVNSDGTWELNEEAQKLSGKNRRKLLLKLRHEPRTDRMTDDDWGETASVDQRPVNAAADVASGAAHDKNQAIGEAPSGIRPSSWTAWTSRFVKVNSDGTWELNEEAQKLSGKNRRKLLLKLRHEPRTDSTTDDDWATM